VHSQDLKMSQTDKTRILTLNNSRNNAMIGFLISFCHDYGIRDYVNIKKFYVTLTDSEIIQTADCFSSVFNFLPPCLHFEFIPPTPNVRSEPNRAQYLRKGPRHFSIKAHCDICNHSSAMGP